MLFVVRHRRLIMVANEHMLSPMQNIKTVKTSVLFLFAAYHLLSGSTTCRNPGPASISQAWLANAAFHRPVGSHRIAVCPSELQSVTFRRYSRGFYSPSMPFVITFWHWVFLPRSSHRKNACLNRKCYVPKKGRFVQSRVSAFSLRTYRQYPFSYGGELQSRLEIP